jgi:hypothetical protein
MEKYELIEAANGWLDHLERRRGLTKHTVDCYASSLRLFVAHLPATYGWEDIDHCVDVRMGDRVSVPTARRTWDAMHLFFRWWAGHGGPADPFIDRVPPDKPDALRRPLSELELRILLECLQNASARDRAMILLLTSGDQGQHPGARDGDHGLIALLDRLEAVALELLKRELGRGVRQRGNPEGHLGDLVHQEATAVEEGSESIEKRAARSQRRPFARASMVASVGGLLPCSVRVISDALMPESLASSSRVRPRRARRMVSCSGSNRIG